jgi:hypothetical protein
VASIPPARDALAAAAIIVGSLLARQPECREWLDDLIEKQHLTFRGADAIQAASRAIMREVDQPMSVIGRLDHE